MGPLILTLGRDQKETRIMISTSQVAGHTKESIVVHHESTRMGD